MSVRAEFEAAFGRPPDAAASVPGRVNLIGEHIDYTGGTVLPTVIGRRVTLGVAATAGPEVTIRSARYDEAATRAPDEALAGHWSDYVLAGHRSAVRRGLAKGGAAYWVGGDVPDGAGVSSSAALLVALLRALSEAAGRDEGPETLARWAQAVERDEIGVPCGIMDQMAVAAGKPGYAMKLDTRTLAHAHVPLPDGYAFPVLHSGLRRALADGAYAERRAQCQAAADGLGLDGLEALSPSGEAGLARLDALPSVVARRARHAITEHARVLDAANALAAGDIDAFGALMDESHASMRDDFEIVPEAMDAMTETARRLGAVGARLTGGGFGGCFVSCVPRGALNGWLSGMTEAFPGTRAVSA